MDNSDDSATDSEIIEAKVRDARIPTRRRDIYMVPMVFVTFVIMRALDRVFLYRVTKLMAPYTSTLMSLYWPPMVQFMCSIVCVAHVIRKRILTKDPRYGIWWFSPNSPMASEQGPVPMVWVAMFSFWDQLNAMISAPPSPFIPLVLQTPLNNTVVFWTALIAHFYLKTRFKSVHYAGIVIIILSCFSGVVVELQGPPKIVCDGLSLANKTMTSIRGSTVVPSIVGTYTLAASTANSVAEATSKCVRGLPPYRDSNGNLVYIAFGTLSTMYMLYIVAIIPTAFSNCYKQKKLKQVNLDIMWSFFWAGMWQVLWGFLMYPFQWVPWPEPGGHNEKTPMTIVRDLSDSWTCFLGENPSPLVTTCSAEPAWVWFVVYLIFNVFFNLLFLWLIKRLSGTWASIGSIVCGNLCGVFSQYRIFGGDSAAPLTMEQWLALALSSVAMWVYNTEEETDSTGQSVYDDKAGGDHRYDDHGKLGIDPDSDFVSDEERTAVDHGVL